MTNVHVGQERNISTVMGRTKVTNEFSLPVFVDYTELGRIVLTLIYIIPVGVQSVVAYVKKVCVGSKLGLLK